MAAEVKVVRVAASRTVLEPDWLARAEPVHRELRPDLPGDYAQTMQRIVADGGDMAAAVADDAWWALPFSAATATRRTASTST
jgi:hypothetical protein